MVLNNEKGQKLFFYLLKKKVIVKIFFSAFLLAYKNSENLLNYF